MLVAAVPHIPSWRLDHLPRTMTDEQLRLFLARFDRSTPTGRRDYAMALCQVDLGLRVSEVSTLRLEDVDWRAATLRIEGGKSRRTRELPLTEGSGERSQSTSATADPRLPVGTSSSAIPCR